MVTTFPYYNIMLYMEVPGIIDPEQLHLVVLEYMSHVTPIDKVRVSGPLEANIIL